MTLLTPAWLSYIQFPDVLILLLMLCYSGEVIRSFVPIDKILKPVLLECVTPVTCYWTLSLIVCEESEMVLVFKVKLFFALGFILSVFLLGSGILLLIIGMLNV